MMTTLKNKEDEKTELAKRARKHRRKGQPRKIVQGYTQISDQEEAGGEKTSNFSQCIAWVQCSFPSCAKWRRLLGNTDPSVLPDDWSCSQNTDLQFNHCDIPEENWSGCETDVVYASYIPGSIIWAKQYGYPWWPGMVESDPDLGEYFLFASQQDVLPSKYHVTFFGDTASRAWIPSNMLKNFRELSLEQVEPVRSSQELRKRIRNKDCSQKLMAALVMAQDAQRISIQDRLSLFGFHIRYKEDAAESGSSEEGRDLFFQEAKKPHRAGNSNSYISKEENKESCSTKCNLGCTSKKKLKLKGVGDMTDEQDETPKRKKNKFPSQDSTSVEEKGSSGNSHPDQSGLNKKFTAPQRKTTVTKLPGNRGKSAFQNQFPPTPSQALPLVEAGKKSDPQWSLILMSRNPPPENKGSNDLNPEQLMEEVREGINQKVEQQIPIAEKDEISLVLSEE
ncbi:zinc finger CW-type PWWP domain protein 1 isoform X2 [Sarcophilus harrisii]|uniref:zinc finger CW-type PWWP domain protein 1 isoform X2 n=1 Tax=Sarcophilus harrisii TaxID=9305 RepID=UPI001301E0F6|nr:zinc finger CW-type PWWP domain protein 1 isoform X2 [Sarcophilus harrisii]XP_031821148.1 zinc finger CW-type PWWP domain protein 1 isoform X2 [Sarcophilus harrisii]XP_031821149.1 zinc finger CW-type PWWP domain protein 1 isoform X2 [Sarcophilus harrisii]XP_031821150.1 zinc finger CW-type PWWP domain protein 1 isoform X2 [Sarcophilus harrisii]